MTKLDMCQVETTDWRYGKISYLKNDLIIGRSLREYGEWAQSELNLLLDIVCPGNTIVDIGAFIGTHTIAFAQRVGPDGLVYAFEPNPIAFELLSSNIKQNAFSNVKAFNVALSDSLGLAYMLESNFNNIENPGGFSLYLNSLQPLFEKCERTVQLSILDKFDIRRCDLIKIDTEGMEYNVLKGSSDILKRFNPLVFAECLSVDGGWKSNLVMRDYGYEAFLHNEPAFNPQNFRNNPNNFFAEARETSILFIPKHRVSVFQNSYKQFENLIPIKTVDDLVLGLIKKPQYKYETLAKTEAAKVLGTGFMLNEPEQKNLISRVDRVDSLEQKIQNISSNLDKINSQLSDSKNKEDQIKELTSFIREKDSEIEALTIRLAQQDKEKDEIAQLLISSNKLSEVLKIELAQKSTQINSLNMQIQHMQHGTAMQLVTIYRRVIDKSLPHGTRRRRIYSCLLRGIRIILNEGWKVFWSKFFNWLKRRVGLKKRSSPDNRLIVHNTSQSVDNNIINNIASSTFTENIQSNNNIDRYNWNDYQFLSHQISEDQKARLNRMCSETPQLISIDDKEFVQQAKSLRFTPVDNPQVSVVIPTSGNNTSIFECLTSILKNTEDIPYEIIVTREGSSNKNDEALLQVQGIKNLQNGPNIGPLQACNQAAEEARGEYLLILQDSVQVTKGWLSPLLETFLKNEKVGAVGPKIIYPDGRLYQAGVKLNLDASSTFVGNNDDPKAARYNYVRETEFCPITCLLMETNRFRVLGGFDNSFSPQYYGDADICFRFRDRGFHIFYNPEATVIFNTKSIIKTVSPYEEQLKIRNTQLFLEKWQKQVDEINRIKLIAFYLPQFHTIPENDLWWGKGFTEWTNVTKARPNFDGHYQPHLPADLSFYDLRNEDIMEKQAELARRYGISGFCYYYYWFQGKRLLELPLERMLKTGKPDFPFCLSWANESWTRTWDGQEHEVLISQQYSDEDDRAVIKDIIRYIQQPNYIRINGKPVFLIYRAGNFPNIKRTTDTWREICIKNGIGEIYLIMEEAFEHAKGVEHPSKYGFDASVERPLFRMPLPIPSPSSILNPNYTGTIYDYRDLVLMYAKEMSPSNKRFRSVIAGWDNTPRRQNTSRIFINNSPGAYQAWLETVIKLTKEQNFGDERIVFVNAWNEWAEGDYLEPDQRFGHGFLEATLNAVEHNLLKS